MRFLRRFTLFVAVPLLGLSVIAGVSLWSLQRYFSDSTHIKTWLVESNIYPALQSELVAQSMGNIGISLQEGGVSVPEPVLEKALGRAVSVEFLQQNAEKGIDETYRWLKGETPTPDLSIDVLTGKKAFAQTVSDSARQRLGTLPDCVLPGQATTTDPFLVNCEPPADITKAELARLRNEIVADNEFLPKDTTIDSLLTDVQPQAETPKLWYEQVSYLPTVFQWSQFGPLLFLVIGLVSIALIVLSSTSRQNGGRRAATTVLIASLTLALSTGVIIFIASTMRQTNTDSVALHQPVFELFRLATTAVGRWQLVTCLILALISGGALLGLRFVKNQNPTPAGK